VLVFAAQNYRRASAAPGRSNRLAPPRGVTSRRFP